MQVHSDGKLYRGTLAIFLSPLDPDHPISSNLHQISRNNFKNHESLCSMAIVYLQFRHAGRPNHVTAFPELPEPPNPKILVLSLRKTKTAIGLIPPRPFPPAIVPGDLCLVSLHIHSFFFLLALPKMPAATRAILRQSQFLTRRTVVRHASSTSEAASKAGQSASNAASKAQEGLSKATAAAGPALSNAASALRKVGGPVGKVVSFVDCKR
jgi:hypothetical protein